MNTYKIFEYYLQEFSTVLLTNHGLSQNTIENYVRDLRHWMLFYENDDDLSKILHDTDCVTLKHYINQLSGKKFSIATINRKISSLRVFFNFLYRQGYIKSNFATQLEIIKRDVRLPKVLINQDVENLLSIPVSEHIFLQIRNLCILEILYATGVRVTELVTIKYPPLSANQVMLLIKGKGNKERALVLHDRCKKILELYLMQRKRYLRDRKSPWLFFMKCNIDRHMTRQCCNLILRACSVRMGLKRHIYPHLIRHTIASHLLNNGMNLRYLQYFLGHSSINTVQIYTHLSTQKLRDSINRHPLCDSQNYHQLIHGVEVNDVDDDL